MHNERADSAQQRLPKRWELLSAEQLCRMPVWDGFAKYLMEYISQSARSDDGFLAVGTQLDYFGAALNAAAARFKATGSDRVKIFFTCLDTRPALTRPSGCRNCATRWSRPASSALKKAASRSTTR